MIEPADAKRVLRALARARSVPAAPVVAALIEGVCALELPPGAVVAGVWPLPGEPDLTPAWCRLHERGHAVLLPETTPRGTPLLFRRWRPDDALLPGRFGTRHPDGAVVLPDIVFVPLLAWDRRLRRLGYGGGYYDRTLAGLPAATAIGFGFSGQEVASVPNGPYDVALDAMLTERDLLTAEGRDFADIVSGRHRRAQRT